MSGSCHEWYMGTDRGAHTSLGCGLFFHSAHSGDALLRIKGEVLLQALYVVLIRLPLPLRQRLPFGLAAAVAVQKFLDACHPVQPIVTAVAGHREENCSPAAALTHLQIHQASGDHALAVICKL